MADFDRSFKKNTVLNLVEGDADNGNPDGPLLNLDSPDFKVISININAESKILTIEVLFRADQLSVKQEHKRFFNIDLIVIPAGARNKFRDIYDFVTDNLIKVLPQLQDGIEI